MYNQEVWEKIKKAQEKIGFNKTTNSCEFLESAKTLFSNLVQECTNKKSEKCKIAGFLVSFVEQLCSLKSPLFQSVVNDLGSTSIPKTYASNSLFANYIIEFLHKENISYSLTNKKGSINKTIFDSMVGMHNDEFTIHQKDNSGNAVLKTIIDEIAKITD